MSTFCAVFVVSVTRIVLSGAIPVFAGDKYELQTITTVADNIHLEKNLDVITYFSSGMTKQGSSESQLNQERSTGATSNVSNINAFIHSNSSKQSIRVAPKYMLDIFRQFTNNPYTKPASDIIRSFFNEANEQIQTEFRRINACPLHVLTAGCTRRHLLSFDVSSISSHEKILMAELRLYKIVEMDRKTFTGNDRKVDVFELSSQTDTILSENAEQKKLLLDSKRIIGRASGWETFYITKALRRWVNNANKTHHLEVLIDNISEEGFNETVEFEEHSKTTNEPLLIVFSSEKRNYLNTIFKERDPVRFAINSTDTTQSRIKRSLQWRDDVIHNRFQSDRRHNQRKDCHFEEMEVIFKNIGYSWVLNPVRYPAGKCVGECNIPLQGQNYTRHAIVQTMMNRIFPQNHRKPCCVPIKLGPISILYLENNTITFNYKYEGMKVLECGCR